MKTVRQQLIMGGVLCLVGGIGIIGFIILMIRQRQGNLTDYRIWLMLLFDVLILWAGAFYLRAAWREYDQKQAVLKKGKAYWGKIKGYTYDEDQTRRHQANGKYPLILTVRYLNENGDIREISIPTHKYEQKEFPVTYNVPFKLYKGKAALCGPAATLRIQGEDELLLEGLDVEGTIPTVAVICPNCGGEVRIPVGKGVKCSFCGMVLRTNEYGHVIKAEQKL